MGHRFQISLSKRWQVLAQVHEESRGKGQMGLDPSLMWPHQDLITPAPHSPLCLSLNGPHCQTGPLLVVWPQQLRLTLSCCLSRESFSFLARPGLSHTGPYVHSRTHPWARKNAICWLASSVMCPLELWGSVCPTENICIEVGAEGVPKEIRDAVSKNGTHFVCYHADEHSPTS